jgi:hypothetical protein
MAGGEDDGEERTGEDEDEEAQSQGWERLSEDEGR